MAKKHIIQVSFKDEELELYYRIQMRCKLTGKSGWLKEAALEKLEREDNPQMYSTSSHRADIVSSCDIQNSIVEDKLLFDDNSIDNMLMMMK